jgi:flagellar biosynthesis protein FlhG
MISGNTAERADPAPARRNIVAVASGKGGVGKTWFSITLSHALARLGKRTLLFDGDLGLANVDVQLGVTPTQDLGGVLSGRVTMREAATLYPKGGFDILAGRSGSGSLSALPASKLVGLRRELHALADSYDWVVLDLGAGIDRPVRLFAAEVRACLVVATDEPTSITDAYAFIKVSQAEGLGGDMRLVVNMASSTREGERTYATLRKACREFLKLDVPLAGVVRRDDKVKDAIRRQSSLLTRHPNCEAASDVEGIARALCELR